MLYFTAVEAGVPFLDLPGHLLKGRGAEVPRRPKQGEPSTNGSAREIRSSSLGAVRLALGEVHLGEPLTRHQGQLFDHDVELVDEHGVEPGDADGLEPELWVGTAQQLAEGPDGEGQGVLSGGQLFRGVQVLGLELGALWPSPCRASCPATPWSSPPAPPPPQHILPRSHSPVDGFCLSQPC